MSKVYLDASFFIASQVIENNLHQQARQKLNSLRSKTIYYSWLVLDEIIYVLEGGYNFNKKEVVKMVLSNLVDIANTEFISLDSSELEITKYLSSWQENFLKPRDTMHLFLMKEHNIKTIATFDQDFIKNRESLKIKIL